MYDLSVECVELFLAVVDFLVVAKNLCEDFQACGAGLTIIYNVHDKKAVRKANQAHKLVLSALQSICKLNIHVTFFTHTQACFVFYYN